MKYFSMFSGIGGFELGIQNAYESLYNKSQDEGLQTKSDSPSSNSLDVQRATCIGYSEIDKYAIQIYERHFKHTNYGDATKINASELPDFDLLVGGFPCQAFSIAGKRGGLDDARGTLFYDIARIAKEKRPQHLLLENVKGLLSHDNGRTFKLIISTFAELGYNLEWQVLNSKNFGVPQNRERVFIIGHFGRCCGRQVFPLGHTDDQIDKERIVSTALDANYWKGIDNHAQRTAIVVKGMLSDEKWDNFNESSRRVYDPSGISPTLPTVAGGGHTPKIDVKELEQSLKERGLEITEKGYESLDSLNKVKPAQWRRTEKGKEFRRESQKLGKDLTPFGVGYRELVPKDSDIIGTITSQAIAKDSLLFEGLRIRRLTPTECERLQGYPDGWTEGVSDTQRYKTLGNSVTVNVIEEIIKRLYEPNNRNTASKTR